MEKENNKNKKKKIKIKAGTSSNRTFLLKREFLYKETETLLLTNIVNKKVPPPGKNLNKAQLNVASSNIIKLNEQNKNTNKKILTISKISKT